MYLKQIILALAFATPFISQAETIKCIGRDDVGFKPTTKVSFEGKVKPVTSLGKTLFVGSFVFRVNQANGAVFTETVRMATDFQFDTRILNANRLQKNAYGAPRLQLDAHLFAQKNFVYSPQNSGGIKMLFICTRE